MSYDLPGYLNIVVICEIRGFYQIISRTEPLWQSVVNIRRPDRRFESEILPHVIKHLVESILIIAKRESGYRESVGGSA